MHRIDTMYGPNMSDTDLEWMRMNRFFILSEGGHAVTMDELNEFLNLWNKSCVSVSTFEMGWRMVQHQEYQIDILMGWLVVHHKDSQMVMQMCFQMDYQPSSDQ